MRKITNKSNLPAPLVRAIELDPYAADCDFSTTTLIKPPRIVALERLHENEIVEDASDRIWSLMGQLGHLVLERAGMGELVERRFKINCQGKTIGGQVDLWNNQILLDYKFTSIWAAKDGVKPEWEQQMNINAFLCGENGVHVSAAQIVCIFRDWSVGEARRNKDYPQQQVRVLDVKLWHFTEQVKFIMDRLHAHTQAQIVLPECTPLERWARDEKWAVMKEGREKAVRLYDNQLDATHHAAGDQSGKLSVVHRPAINIRCEDYCAVAEWCEQFKQLKNEKIRSGTDQSPVSREQNG